MTDAGVNKESASRRGFDLVLRQSEILVPRVADSFRELQCQWLPDIVARDRLEVVAEVPEVFSKPARHLRVSAKTSSAM